MSVKKSIQQFFSVLMIIFFIIAVTAIKPASAESLIVLNCNDSGSGSLRSAVADALENDTITFNLDCPITSPITLTSQIEIDKAINISGNGHDIVISGDNASRIFNISFLYQASKTLNLEYLTLTNGKPLDGNGGGAIYNSGVNLNLAHVTFTNNSSGSGQDGGALIQGQGGGSLIISNSVFEGNSAPRNGGAIYTNLPHPSLIQPLR